MKPYFHTDMTQLEIESESTKLLLVHCKQQLSIANLTGML